MQKQSTTNKRPGTAAERLERMLLAQIQSGQLKADDRIPSVDVLSEQLNAHPITLQRALQRLAGKGILERRPRLGTFVRQGLDVFRSAVVFGPSLAHESSLFYRALLRAIRESLPGPNWQCFPYDGLNDANETSNPPSALKELPAFRHFLSDHQHYGFRGFISVGVGDVQWAGIIRTAVNLPVVRLLGQPGGFHSLRYPGPEL